MRKGAPWLKTVLIQCAWAGARKKGSYLEAQFHRLRARRGAKKAVGAVAASILTAAYHMIANGVFYQDLGPDHFDRRAKPNRIKRLAAKFQSLGYDVEIKPLAAFIRCQFLSRIICFRRVFSQNREGRFWELRLAFAAPLG